MLLNLDLLFLTFMNPYFMTIIERPIIRPIQSVIKFLTIFLRLCTLFNKQIERTNKKTE